MAHHAPVAACPGVTAVLLEGGPPVAAGRVGQGAEDQGRATTLGGFQAISAGRGDSAARGRGLDLSPTHLLIGTVIVVLYIAACYYLHRWLGAVIRARRTARTRRASTVAIRRGVRSDGSTVQDTLSET
ncbi:MAG: hypothetical protein LUE17_17705 [Planctomycetaceae bacterium]|nr:hypothetical protein [Planctomycetaceae bacterium]